MDRADVAEIRTRGRNVRNAVNGSWQQDLSASAIKTLSLLCDDVDRLLDAVVVQEGMEPEPVPLRSKAPQTDT